MDMKTWLHEQMTAQRKKPLPLLSFPGICFLNGITVRQLLDSSALQANCLAEVASRTDSAACVSFMDLSVEAEAFGADIQFFDEYNKRIPCEMIQFPFRIVEFKILQLIG